MRNLFASARRNVYFGPDYTKHEHGYDAITNAKVSILSAVYTRLILRLLQAILPSANFPVKKKKKTSGIKAAVLIGLFIK